jgi:hypothetical protein
MYSKKNEAALKRAKKKLGDALASYDRKKSKESKKSKKRRKSGSPTKRRTVRRPHIRSAVGSWTLHDKRKKPAKRKPAKRKPAKKRRDWPGQPKRHAKAARLGHSRKGHKKSGSPTRRRASRGMTYAGAMKKLGF